MALLIYGLELHTSKNLLPTPKKKKKKKDLTFFHSTKPFSKIYSCKEY